MLRSVIVVLTAGLRGYVYCSPTSLTKNDLVSVNTSMAEKGLGISGLREFVRKLLTVLTAVLREYVRC